MWRGPVAPIAAMPFSDVLAYEISQLVTSHFVISRFHFFTAAFIAAIT